MANIQEIAKRAGVSSATVSRVINKRDYVSEETRIKVQAVIDELDYVPNLNAVSLKKGATKLIGIVAPMFMDSPGIFMQNFTNAAQEHGYNVTLFMTKGDQAKELEALEMLRRKQIDALVLVIRQNDWDVIAPYTKYGPIVTWQRVEHKQISSVFMDQYEGYTLGLEHLYQKGYRRICNVYGMTSGLNTQSRMQAYQDFCKRHDLNPHAVKQFYGMGSRAQGEELVHFFRTANDKPDAFFTPNDYLAAGIISEARRQHLKIPDDFAVCGFDDMEVAHLLDMTTIHYPIDKQALNAFTIIHNKLVDETEDLLKLQFYLVERKTT
ncbi:putative LacI family transcriptional regulator [Listeria floridensis FSL S10-1187]|uniref:LacI family transcriptional regulator n=1 Tax=Listeria floridensis FSL S10-1187 TaxID=1265817 RepID=A0ABP3AZ50_9LIST|nr:LacI family DNA-binding transcriptional regulator [Listeria floridensis]EUJ31260.1 putative LacI family transcriptional regulator [Listeria floridensis FSL S10-1187]